MHLVRRVSAWPTCLAVLILLIVSGCKPPTASNGAAAHPPGVKPTGPAVELVIDFDDGFQKHYKLPWRESATVLDALESASRRQRGITYTVRGSGDMTMVTAIDGVANQGGDGRNWIYRVNGRLADKSCGVYETQPDDVIMWTFGTYE